MEELNKDKLEVIFEMQGALDGYIREQRNLDFTPGEWVQKRCLALISELAEVIEEAKFKWWKNNAEIDYPALKEELVDVLHFWVGMCIDSGMTAQEVFDIYYAKNKENFDRQNGLSKKKGYELKDKK
ncbi:MAG: dUTPase [Clostridia bacterium]|nr:dUTPase [Clostridia bacterium]